MYAAQRDWSVVSDEIRARIVWRGEQVCRGEYEAYGAQWRRLPTNSSEWRTHPVTGAVLTNGPWWTVPHLAHGTDIKDVWEPSRFGWVYDLARAYAVSGDQVFVDAFDRHFRQWMHASPPFAGPQWACGQETAIRALAILHAEAILVPATTDVDVPELVRTVLVWSGERIADAIEYGLSQRNNHGLSEAAGLIHLGLRFKGELAVAERWVRKGKQHLADQIRDQFAEDGWYAQHSFTYLRLALDQVALAQRRLVRAEDSLPSDCLQRLKASVDLLSSMVCEHTGVAPNHGANDGARVIQYSSAPVRDFRPVLTLAASILDCPLPGDVPADQESEAWLGTRVRHTTPRTDGVITGPSGWAVARMASASVFLRAGTPRHRPSHLDALQVDVRIGATEVIADAGTYAYNAPRPWNNGLVSAMVHNGPVVNDVEPGIRGPRFLWYTFPSATILETTVRRDSVCVVAEVRDAVSEASMIRRTVRVERDAVYVEDRPLNARVTSVQVTWLLHPGARARASVDVDVEDPRIGRDDFTLEHVDATADHLIGWFSPTYGSRQASRAVRCRVTNVTEETRVRTRIGMK